MPTVRDLLARRASPLVAVAPDATVLEAARLMARHDIGGLAVIEQDRLLGIFTERDLLRRVVAEHREPVHTRVREVMTTPVLTCTTSTTVDGCAAIMDARRLRHLPVVENDRVVDMVSIRDVLALRLAEQATQIAELNRYVAGSY